jgi:hypothetical protein
MLAPLALTVLAMPGGRVEPGEDTAPRPAPA